MRNKLNLNDFMNKKYGCLTIIGIAESNTDVRRSKVKVRCDCGKESIKILNNVLVLPSRCSKGCESYGINHARKTADKYINKKYGHLTILSYVGRKAFYVHCGDKRITQNKPFVKCRCDCGRIVDLNLQYVIHGNVTACGKCKFSALLRHGLATNKDPVADKLNSSYTHIIKRARSSFIPEIQISKEWFNDDDPISAILNFVSYCRPLYEKVMNDGTDKHIFIHRIDINKPFGPGNVYFDHHLYNIHYSGKVFY